MGSDTVNIHFIRVTVLLVILVTALAVLSACSEPEPTPTPTPLPTATPTPTPLPTATPPPASGAPQLLLGEDIMAMLPAEGSGVCPHNGRRGSVCPDAPDTLYERADFR